MWQNDFYKQIVLKNKHIQEYSISVSCSSPLYGVLAKACSGLTVLTSLWFIYNAG
jgi:hypothetical protein